eukprot:11915559-Karenia_brevis.AAC.1
MARCVDRANCVYPFLRIGAPSASRIIFVIANMQLTTFATNWRIAGRAVDVTLLAHWQSAIPALRLS